jgi:hypothetical protein
MAQPPAFGVVSRARTLAPSRQTFSRLVNSSLAATVRYCRHGFLRSAPAQEASSALPANCSGRSIADGAESLAADP